MPISDADLWHQVHAQREDGVAAMFLIRDVEPRADQPQIFVIELPYPVTDLSKLPDAAGYQRLDTFQEEWVEPACEALGWTFVAWKSEDGSFFLYLYGDGDPNALLERLAAFDDALGFFNDRDADWSEYAALRELVEQAQAAPQDEDEGEADHVHTDDCDHADDLDARPTIPVIDLSGISVDGERPAKARTAKPRPAMPKPAMAKPAKPKPAKAKPAKAKPAKAKPTKAKTAQAKTAQAKTAQAKPTKAKPAKAKSTNAKPTKSKPAKAKPIKAATVKSSKKPTSTKPTAPRPSAKRPTAAKPAAGKRAEPRTSRR